MSTGDRSRDPYLQRQRNKQEQSNEAIDREVKIIAKTISDLQRRHNSLLATRDGIAKSLERDAEATDEERLDRAYKQEVRKYLGDVRLSLKGNRIKACDVSTKSSRVFEYILRIWSQKGKPEKGVYISRSVIALAARCATEREVDRALQRLQGHVSSVLRGRGKKRGRSPRRFTFPRFPRREEHARTWDLEYGREAYNETSAFLQQDRFNETQIEEIVSL